MFPIIGIIAGILGIFLVVVNFEDVSFGLGIVGIIFWIAISMISIGAYFNSVARIADLESFQLANKQAFEVTSKQTGEAVIRLSSNPAFQISVENLKQSTNWSDRIKELRNRVIWYNLNLNRLRTYNRNWWLYLMFANPPKELELLILE